jgi:hypothetical protein
MSTHNPPSLIRPQGVTSRKRYVCPWLFSCGLQPFPQNGRVRASRSNSPLGHSNIPLQGNSLADYACACRLELSVCLAGWTVGAGGLAQTLCPNVCDAPTAQFGRIAPLALTCPFGTSQTPHVGVCASQEWRSRERKADC